MNEAKVDSGRPAAVPPPRPTGGEGLWCGLRRLFVVAAFFVVAALFGGGAAAAGEGPGRLTITSDPAGAQIFIDGGMAGITTVTRSLAAREYYVEVHWPDGASKVQNVKVIAAQSVTVTMTRDGRPAPAPVAPPPVAPPPVAPPPVAPPPVAPPPIEPAPLARPPLAPQLVAPPPVYVAPPAPVAPQPVAPPPVYVAPVAPIAPPPPPVAPASPTASGTETTPLEGAPGVAPAPPPTGAEPGDEYSERPPASGPKARWTPFDLTLYSNVGVFGWFAPNRVVTGFEYNLLYSRTRSFYGIGIGAFARVDRDFGGLAFNIAANIVKGNAWGIQLSAWLNIVRGRFGGLQFAVGKNVVSGATGRGIQLAVLKNETMADFSGLQIAAFVNEASGREFSGAQLGMLNWSEAETYYGNQTGVVNLVWGGMSGIQMGAVNIVLDTDRPKEPDFADYHAWGDFSGMMIGVVNIGGWVRGVQLGVFNYARSLTGLQLGLINIARKGGVIFLPIINAGGAKTR